MCGSTGCLLRQHHPTTRHNQAHDFGKLGTEDADALDIQSRALFSADELRAKKRRIVEGVADNVELRQPK